MPPEDQAGTEVVPVVSGKTLQLFAEMAAGIPEADDSDAYETIVSQLLAADTVDQLNAPWDTDAVEKLAGHQILIQDLTRRPSDFAGGLGMYLVAKGTDQGTGEKVTVTTGAVSVVAQLARAYFVGGLPIIAKWIIGDPSPRTGRRPQHLEIVALASASPKERAAAAAAAGNSDGPAPF
jgi:hypothetical protein